MNWRILFTNKENYKGGLPTSTLFFFLNMDLHPDYRFKTRRVTAQIKRAKYIVKWKPFSKACVVPFAPLGIQLAERGLREHRWNITVDALNSPGNILAREYRWKNSPIPLIPFLVMSSKNHLEDITIGKIHVCIAYKIFATEKLMDLLHSQLITCTM